MRRQAVLAFILASGYSHASIAAFPGYSWPDISGPYLGQPLPGMQAEIFAPGIISTDQSEINSVFTPDGKEFYFTFWAPETGTKILVTRLVDGRWTVPEVASFSNHPSDVDPAISPDGSKVFFGTRRPRPGTTADEEKDFDLWFAERAGGNWGAEKYLGPVINSGQRQVYPTVTREGTLYFQAIREEGYGKADIYRSRLVDGAYQPPENLGPAINSEHYEGDVFVAPDESYLIVAVSGREDSLGGADLYISFRGLDAAWSPLENMGDSVNSEQRDFCPMVSPDGKYFFFSSNRRGSGDIFWIDAKVIESLRQRLVRMGSE